jgi:hypothetical protein
MEKNLGRTSEPETPKGYPRTGNFSGIPALVRNAIL